MFMLASFFWRTGSESSERYLSVGLCATSQGQVTHDEAGKPPRPGWLTLACAAQSVATAAAMRPARSPIDSTMAWLR
jgi:hypothetical protein